MKLSALLAILVVFIAGCASSGNSEHTATTVSEGETQDCPAEYKNAEPVETADSITYRVCAKSFSFEPHTLKVKMEKKTILDIYSPDIPHSLKIAELEVEERLPTGQKTVEFTPIKKGEFDVICTVPGHKEAGMLSKIIVE